MRSLVPRPVAPITAATGSGAPIYDRETDVRADCAARSEQQARASGAIEGVAEDAPSAPAERSADRRWRVNRMFPDRVALACPAHAKPSRNLVMGMVGDSCAGSMSTPRSAGLIRKAARVAWDRRSSVTRARVPISTSTFAPKVEIALKLPVRADPVCPEVVEAKVARGGSRETRPRCRTQVPEHEPESTAAAPPRLKRRYGARIERCRLHVRPSRARAGVEMGVERSVRRYDRDCSPRAGRHRSSGRDRAADQ